MEWMEWMDEIRKYDTHFISGTEFDFREYRWDRICRDLASSVSGHF